MYFDVQCEIHTDTTIRLQTLRIKIMKKNIYNYIHDMWDKLNNT